MKYYLLILGGEPFQISDVELGRRIMGQYELLSHRDFLSLCYESVTGVSFHVDDFPFARNGQLLGVALNMLQVEEVVEEGRRYRLTSQSIFQAHPDSRVLIQ